MVIGHWSLVISKETEKREIEQEGRRQFRGNWFGYLRFGIWDLATWDLEFFSFDGF